MSVTVSERIRKLFNDPKSHKVLATVSRDGIVNVAFKDSIGIDKEGNLEYLELLESSQTNRNMTNAIWFDRMVAVNAADDSGISVQIKGIPFRYTMVGPRFEEAYARVREQDPDSDLAGIWSIHPVEVIEETYVKRRQKERKLYPIIGHIDRDLL